MSSRNFRPAGMSDDSDEDDDGFEFGGFDGGSRSTTSYAPPSPAAVEAPEPVTWRDEAFGGRRGLAATAAKVSAELDPNVSSLSVEEFKTALLNNDVGLVKKCLTEHGHSVEQAFYGMEGRNPVFLACQCGLPDVLQVLLDHGAELMPDEDGVTPLMTVCASTGRTPWMGFDGDGDSDNDGEERLLECAKLLCQARPDLVNQSQNQRKTALMFAAKQGHHSLCRYLVELDAKVDVRDSQDWTALCFAAGEGHGAAARVLLDAKADPDCLTREGLCPADLAGGRGDCEVLEEIIDLFSKKRSLLSGEDFRQRRRQQRELATGVRTFSEMDNILMGMDLTEYMPLFEKHKITIEHFLTLNEQDLQKMGIETVGDRKRIIDGICSIHKKEWEKTSLPALKPRDKQKGIYLTCPDCVGMMDNIGQHFRYLSATLQYIRLQLVEHPELLTYGQDQVHADVLFRTVAKGRQQIRQTTKKLDALYKVVQQLHANPQLKPADLIGPDEEADDQSQGGAKKKWALCVGALAIGAVCLVKYYGRK